MRSKYNGEGGRVMESTFGVDRELMEDLNWCIERSIGMEIILCFFMIAYLSSFCIFYKGLASLPNGM